jgi:phosphate transport system substrate-binding protein
MRKLTLFFLVAIGGAGLNAATYTINGSNTMYPLNVKLASLYQQSHANTVLRVVDDGTNKGVTALASGEADIAATTRALRPEESKAIRKRYGRDAIAQLVAVEGVSIYLHPRNAVASLTLEQIAGIFTGRFVNWKEVGGTDTPIHIYSFSNDTGRHYFMVDNVLNKGTFAKGTVYAKPNPALPANQRLVDEERQVLQMVSQDPYAISYGDLKRVRLVKIAQIRTNEGSFWPTPEHLQTGRYPLARSLHYYVRPDAPPPLLDFVRWAPRQSDVIRELNFAPLK